MNFRFSFFANVMLDSGDIRDGDDVTQRFLFKNVSDMIARADEQMIRAFHSQCFAVGGVDRERLKWLSLLQLTNFVRDHTFRLVFSIVTDKIDNNRPIVAAVSDRRTVRGKVVGAHRAPLQKHENRADI